MKTYSNNSLWAQEFSVEGTLTIEDDGRFVYDESWSSYGGGFNGRAKGSWRRSGGAIYFRCESTDGALAFHWPVDSAVKAEERDDAIDFGGVFTFSLDAPPPAKKETKPSAPAAEEAPPVPPPSVARLHFQDGRVLEKPLAPSPLFGLVDEMYYRLTGDEGRDVLFRPRPRRPRSDPRVVEYDEM